MDVRRLPGRPRSHLQRYDASIPPRAHRCHSGHASLSAALARADSDTKPPSPAGLTRAYPDTEPRATRPEPDAPPSAGHAPWTERMVECRVGGFRTIAGLYWSGAWRSTPEILRLARAPGDGALSDGLIEAPACVCVARAALQLLNWRSMSGEAAADQNCLPARVYLTRPCKLACRCVVSCTRNPRSPCGKPILGGRACWVCARSDARSLMDVMDGVVHSRGQVVGYVTYNSEPTKQFPLPSINATYVAPEGRRKVVSPSQPACSV